MSYPNSDKELNLKWRKFLQENHELINHCGLPLEFYSNLVDWFHFIEHGFYKGKKYAHGIMDMNEKEYSNYKVLLRSFFEYGFEYMRPCLKNVKEEQEFRIQFYK